MKPYFGIVATSRNDNHGGDLNKRMQIFINGIIQQAEKYKVETELIMVEWNPPEGKDKLKDILKFPEKSPYCKVRIIEVPPEIHNRLIYADGLPLYQMIAKNVGIVRSDAEFIVATNIDILFSNSIFEFIAKKKLEKGRLYRCDRHDVDTLIPLDATIDEQLEYADKNIVRINTRFGQHNMLNYDYQEIYSDDIEEDLENIKSYAPLHTNACGDFQLMYKDDWKKVRGYAEFDMYSFHLDSLLEFSAHFGGVKEIVLPETMRCYHIEHGGGFKPETVNEMHETWEKKKVPRLSYDEFVGWAKVMQMSDSGIVFNQQHWGYSDIDLPDETVTKMEVI